MNTQPSPTSESHSIDRSAHVLLVVDDDPVTRYATCRLLKSAGFPTIEASTGLQGLALAQGHVSAVVLDIHLPDIDGLEVCRRLRLNPATARLPVLHLTASYITDIDKVRGLDSGADAYLTHPVEPAVLVASVQALVRARIAEEAGLRSEAKFKAIYDVAPNGICLFDDDGRFLDANPALLALLKRPLGEVIGRPLAGFVPVQWGGAVADFIGQLDASTERSEFPVLDDRGGEVHLEWSMSPHVDAGVRMVQVVDISGRVSLQQQREQMIVREREARTAAERLNRMKDEFIAVLSHELRSPLNAMMGWAHVLARQDNGEQAKKGLEAIVRNGRAQARLIGDLLDVSRINTGKTQLERRPLDVVEVVESAVVALGAAEVDAQRVRIDAEPGLPLVHADANRLQQVIWNLLSNAAKFSAADAPIDVVLRRVDGGVRLTVRDRGQGIAPEFLPRIFDRFSQADSASSRKHGGLGLGLAIVHHLVEAHGGRISVSSEGLGLGASFEVWLPAFDPEADRSAAPAADEGEAEVARESERPLENFRVLVVEDDREAAAMLALVLGDRGAQVTTAHSYDEAVPLLQAGRFDLLISDIGLPGRDGYELIRAVRAFDGAVARIPAIALTAFTQDEDRHRALMAGFDAHSSKPLHPLRLVQAAVQLRRR